MLNIFRIILLLSLIATGSLFASDPVEIMNSANQHYRDGDYNSAIKGYESLVSRGFEGVSLYYNLGNAYYRTGKLGYAILFYEKALKLNPDDEDVIHNLALANIRTVDKIDTMPKFFIFEWWESFLSLFKLQSWIIVTLVIYLALLTSIAFYFLGSRFIHQRISFFSGVTFLILLFISISVVGVKLNRQDKRLEAIIIEKSVVVKLSPDIQGKDGFLIHEGLKVLVEDTIDDWKKIKLADGKIGWIPAEYLLTI